MELKEQEIILGHNYSEAVQKELEKEPKLDIPTPYEEPREEEELRETAEETIDKPEEITAKETETVDDYGIEIPKQEKVYTESEVQAMIRDRLSRGRQAEPEPIYQQPQHQPQEAVQAPADDDWQAQLDSYIEQSIAKREQKIQEQRWQQQEREIQAQFEIKFNQGAAKYPDFEQVVIGKALTPQMVTATRGLSDPAAFIYAAAKTQAPELERIAKINDTYAQAIELGRLEERMRKAKSNVSSAPRPIDAVKGDVTEKVERTRNIDDKIRMEENRLRKERIR